MLQGLVEQLTSTSPSMYVSAISMIGESVTRLVPRKHWYISGPPSPASFLSSSLKRMFSVSRFNSMSKNSGSFEPYIRRSDFWAASILPFLMRKYGDSGKKNTPARRIAGGAY